MQENGQIILILWVINFTLCPQYEKSAQNDKKSGFLVILGVKICPNMDKNEGF